MKLPRLRLILPALLLAAPLALADGLPDLGEAASADLSPAMERRLGESIMNDIRLREPTWLDDPEVERYLSVLGQRLAANTGETELAFRLFAIRDPMINAFATFGGYIGVNTGLMLAAQSESELAGVLAHEMAHVTQRHLARQIAQQRQVSVASMIAMAMAIFAARSNAQVATAALATTQAAGIQNQLAFSRDFEREADRVGFEVLTRSGFDAQGMVGFFERLQRSGRVYENNAPVYLRTHPLTLDRITDMGNRAEGRPRGRHADSVEFSLVRGKLRAMQGSPAEAIAALQGAIQQGVPKLDAGLLFGLAVAYHRDRQWDMAERTLGRLPAGWRDEAMVERLRAELRVAQGDFAGGRAIYQRAWQRNPDAAALWLGYGESLLAAGDADAARRFLEDRLRERPAEHRLYPLLARTHGSLGRIGAQHRVLAEGYLINGQLPLAIEQLQIAQRAAGNDFIEQSMIDARLRELKARQTEEARRPQQ